VRHVPPYCTRCRRRLQGSVTAKRTAYKNHGLLGSSSFCVCACAGGDLCCACCAAALPALCPRCGKARLEGEPTASMAVRAVVEVSAARCPSPGGKCNWTGPRAKLDEHWDQCPHATVPCPVDAKRCHEVMTRAQEAGLFLLQDLRTILEIVS